MMVFLFLYCLFGSKFFFIGFVTHDNLVKKIKEINLLPEEEIPTFLHYMDPSQKGILNFNEFTTKFRPLALKTDEMGRQTIIPNVAPDKEQTQYLQTSLPFIKSAVFNSKEASTPNEKQRFLLIFQLKNNFIFFQLWLGPLDGGPPLCLLTLF